MRKVKLCMHDLKLITTADGSNSLLNNAIGETYHSRHGALQESTHVFIKNGLNYFIEQNTPQKINILEVGLGTGLNAWLTLENLLSKEIEIHYTAIEIFPLPKSIWQLLNYAQGNLHKTSFESIHSCQWNEPVKLASTFYLNKLHNSLLEVDLSSYSFDLIYFDAFAPNKQPELWELPILKKMVDQLLRNGVFVTYCAKGQLKRDLKFLGLEVEALSGPPGKREMIRATKKQ
jgi:tRNA U34 5-methylaminomethyl-2-thiouridine-forming methyltransferase MnmC